MLGSRFNIWLENSFLLVELQLQSLTFISGFELHHNLLNGFFLLYCELILIACVLGFLSLKCRFWSSLIFFGNRTCNMALG